MVRPTSDSATTGLKAIDTHAHLSEFRDIDSVVERAKKSGVAAIVAVAEGHRSNARNLELSRSYVGYIFPALGIHPWEVESDPEAEIATIRENLELCVAVGEIGLDYWIKRDRETQRTVFRKLLKLAAERDKPASIHTRGEGAWEDAYRIVREIGVEKAVFHWYSGPLEVLAGILDSGYFVSAAPSLEYSKAHREAIAKTPMESLLLETDSPVKYRGAGG